VHGRRAERPDPHLPGWLDGRRAGIWQDVAAATGKCYKADVILILGIVIAGACAAGAIGFSLVRDRMDKPAQWAGLCVLLQLLAGYGLNVGLFMGRLAPVPAVMVAVSCGLVVVTVASWVVRSRSGGQRASSAGAPVVATRQLVGQDCARCGKRIAVAMLAVDCRDCGAVHHTACACATQPA